MKQIITILQFFLITNMIIAQEGQEVPSDTLVPPKNIEVDEIEVIKAFEAKLADAQKIYIKPRVVPTVPAVKNYDYNITIVPLKIDYADPVIKPLAMNPDADKPSSKFFAKLGYGDRKSPFGDVSYFTSIPDHYEWGISGHMYGADDSKESIKGRKFMDADLNLHFGYMLKENLKLEAQLGGVYDKRYLYDTAVTNTLVPLETLARNTLNLGFNVGIRNVETTASGIDYRISLRGNHLNLDQKNDIPSIDAQENSVGIDGNFRKRISSHLSFITNFNTDLGTLKIDELEDSKRQVLEANPGFEIAYGDFTMKAMADLIVDNNGTHPFVEAEARYSIWDNNIQVFAGVDQKIESNTLTYRLSDNPFVYNRLDISTNTISNQFYAGIKGAIKDFVFFNFIGGYEKIENQALYDRLDDISLLTIFDDMNNVFVNANLLIKLNEKISIGANVNQNLYDSQIIENIPNMPEYSYDAFAVVKLLENRLIFKTDITLSDKIQYQGLSETVSGNNELDLSSELDFYLTKNIGLWLRANNILDREYLRYENYPMMGRNILGGVLIKF